MSITLKQDRLIKFYLESGNVAEAARLSGYKSRQAAHYFLTNNDLAKNRITAGMKSAYDNVAIRFFEIVKQSDYILDKLLEQQDFKAAVKLIDLKIKFHHLLPGGLALPKTDGSYEQHDLSKLNVEELETLKSLLGKCKPIQVGSQR